MMIFISNECFAFDIMNEAESDAETMLKKMLLSDTAAHSDSHLDGCHPMDTMQLHLVEPTRHPLLTPLAPANGSKFSLVSIVRS